jgi:phosphoglycerate kinase
MVRFATLKDLPIHEGSKVLVRADLNVPLDGKGQITDDTRIRESLPTIQYLLKKKAIVLLLSHLGRPRGIDESLRMSPVAIRLEKLLGQHVLALDDCIGSEVEDAINEMYKGDVAVLENVRFHSEEEANADAFARGIAELADCYVDDAFGTVHRQHASIVGVPKHIPGAAGFLLQKEIAMLSKALRPQKPFVLVLGGAKVGDKMGLLENLAQKADKVLLGGAIAFTFLKAQGKNVGKSPVEADSIALAKRLLRYFRNKFVLPDDFVVANRVSASAKRKIMASTQIPAGWIGMDIGPETIARFIAELKRAKTVVWNGTMGMCELAPFALGTKMVAQAIARIKGTKILGGGSIGEAVNRWKLSKKFSHVSTGGGASLAFLEGKTLPGISALEESAKKFRLKTQ